jgi:hypothetical protein
MAVMKRKIIPCLSKPSVRNATRIINKANKTILLCAVTLSYGISLQEK